MRKLRRLALVACAAIALLALGSGVAAANRGLAIRPGGPIFAEAR